MSKSKILFMMTGSIACYKACQVISRLAQAGHDVQVVASKAALEFVGNATLEGLSGKSVISDMYQAGNVMDHIHLMRWADLIIVAPATANFINKSAMGIGDDFLGTLFLAHDFKKPFLLAPAMNTSMYLHPTTQKSVESLKAMGIVVLEAASGVLACGEHGAGRLLEPDLILVEILQHLKAQQPNGDQNVSRSKNQKVKVLITSGGTQEPIDAVRVITNLSTGKTGATLADLLTHWGVDVTLLHGKTATLPKEKITTKEFSTYQDLKQKMEILLQSGEFTHVVMAAAVSDYTVVDVHPEKKMSSDSEEIQLRLKRNPKLIAKLKAMSPKPVKVVGFKLTSQADNEHVEKAVQKLLADQVDLVVHNDLSEISHQRHVFHVYDGKNPQIQQEGVTHLAQHLYQYLVENL